MSDLFGSCLPYLPSVNIDTLWHLRWMNTDWSHFAYLVMGAHLRAAVGQISTWSTKTLFNTTLCAYDMCSQK